MAVLTREQVAKLLYDQGVRGETLALMTGIPQRESSYRTDAHRTDRDPSRLSGDRGLFQINYIWDDQLKAAGIINSAADLFDPETNVRAAIYVMNSQGPAAWGAGPGGWQTGGSATYGVDMDAARRAAAAVEGNPGAYSSTPSAPAPSYAPAPAPPKPPAPAPEPTVEKLPKLPYPTTDRSKDPERSYSIPDYKAPTADPKQQRTLTNLLKGFGIDYPKGPRATPQLLAFMRGMGMSVETAEDQFEAAREQLQLRAADAAGDLDISDQRRRRTLAVDAQRRGALVSGATNSAFARQAEDKLRAQADIERRLAEGVSEASSGLEAFKDSARQKALETVLAEETSQATTDAQMRAQTEAAQNALSESDLAYERQRQAEERAARRQIDLINAQRGY